MGHPKDGIEHFHWSTSAISLIYITRKYPLRGYILGSGAPGTPGVTLRAFLSPLRHMEQLLLVTSCDSPAGIGASFRTHNGRMDGRTDFYVEIVF